MSNENLSLVIPTILIESVGSPYSARTGQTLESPLAASRLFAALSERLEHINNLAGSLLSDFHAKQEVQLLIQSLGECYETYQRLLWQSHTVIEQAEQTLLRFDDLLKELETDAPWAQKTQIIQNLIDSLLVALQGDEKRAEEVTKAFSSFQQDDLANLRQSWSELASKYSIEHLKEQLVANELHESRGRQQHRTLFQKVGHRLNPIRSFSRHRSQQRPNSIGPGVHAAILTTAHPTGWMATLTQRFSGHFSSPGQRAQPENVYQFAEAIVDDLKDGHDELDGIISKMKRMTKAYGQIKHDLGQAHRQLRINHELAKTGLHEILSPIKLRANINNLQDVLQRYRYEARVDYTKVVRSAEWHAGDKVKA